MSKVLLEEDSIEIGAYCLHPPPMIKKTSLNEQWERWLAGAPLPPNPN